MISLSILLHSLPIIASLYNFYTIDAVIKQDHVYAFLSVEVIYMIINYQQTCARGKPLYWFLDWKDYKTFVALFLINLAFVIGYK